MQDWNEAETVRVPVEPHTTDGPTREVEALLGAVDVAWDWSRLAVTPDRYDLGEPVARGGAGELHRATDRLLGREVAVKVVRADKLGDPDAVTRFLQEARIHAQFHHRGIPPLHDVGRLPDGRPYIAMKFVAGRTLADRLAGRPAPDSELAWYVAAFRQTCDAVAYAHSKGVIHRDLSATNVVVSDAGRVHVIDWGLGKVVAGRKPAPPSGHHGTEQVLIGNLSLTEEGHVLGTPAYIPPEQANGRVGEVDARSDVFGLGGVLCHILTGAPPYPGPWAEVRAQARAGDLSAAFRRLDAAFPPPLAALAKACLAPRPADRPADAAAVARTLADVSRARRPWWARWRRK